MPQAPLEFSGTLVEAIDMGMTIIDIRDPVTAQQQPLAVECQCIPTEALLANVEQLSDDEPILLVCYGGVTSLKVAAELRRQGFEKVFSKPGGAGAA